MNKLLARQVTKYWGHPDNVPHEFRGFLNIISESYDYHERDRSMLERSIELSSDEMIGLNERLRAESRELARAHEELSTLFKNIETVFFTVDLVEKRTVQMSPSCEKIYGYSVEDFLNNPALWFEVVLEEDKHIIQRNYPLMHAGKSFSHVHRIRTKDGNIRWVETKITPTVNAAGLAVRLDGVTSDITAQKQAEELSRAHETRFQKLIEKSHDGIAMMNADGEIIYVSPSVFRILGYAPDEICGKEPAWLIHPDDNDYFRELVQALMSKRGESVRSTYRVKNKIGEWRWISSTITNLLHEKSVNALVFNYHDITEHKATEQQLHFDRRTRDALINSTEDLMWSFDSNTRLITANSAFLAALKMLSGKDCLPGDDLMDPAFLPAEVLAKWEVLYARVLSGESFVYENHETYPFELWGELSFHPIKENGNVIGGSCFWRDITEKKRQQQQLEASQKMMAEAQRISKIGSWEFMFDANNQVIPESSKWSDEVFRIYGIEPGTQAPGMNMVHDLIYTSDRLLVREWTQALMAGLPTGSVNYRIGNNPAEVRWVKATADLIQDPVTKQGKMVGTIQDITERKALEAERRQVTRDLVQRNKALEQFAHIVSHNLRAPVANILGLSQLIKLSGQNSDTQLQCIDGFVLSAKRLDEIVSDLNKILQVKRGATEEKVPVDFESIVHNIQDSIQMTLKEEEVIIETDFDEVPEIYSIKNYVYSVFYNLISNSIKYRKPETRPVINIASRSERGRTVLSFKDNGRGIDLVKHRDDVFGLYKRFHLSGEGKGLGMYMVKTQVESLGGKVSIKSEVDQGTEIIIEL
jgi:PAS domain S-box-containing protein